MKRMLDAELAGRRKRRQSKAEEYIQNADEVMDTWI